MNGSPTVRQKHWHSWLIEQGCCLGFGPASLHHIKGSKAKLKGVDKFGEWYVLPLSYWAHQDGKNKAARHVNKSEFEKLYGKEKDLWIKMVEQYEAEFGEKPVSENEYQVILSRAD